MVRRRKPPPQTWRTFLENPVETMVSAGFPTVTRTSAYANILVKIHHERCKA
jgi:hypothetical protein